MGNPTAAKKNAAALAAWFAKAQRPLPWRADYHPYQVWVSEIMLQQTRVEAVLPYFARWMRQFPNLQSLAQATEPELLKAWEGLGYYSRVRNLALAAKGLVAAGTGIPPTAEELRRLPGIGPYTAAAIASIAFLQPVPLLDGNVKRVFARLLDWAEAVEAKSSETRFLELGASLLAGQSPRVINQGLMELGALVCNPKNPQCPVCPLAEGCLSLAQGTQAQRPVKKAKPEVIKHHLDYGILLHQGRVFLQQQPLGQLWAGMWLFPLTQALALPWPTAPLAQFRYHVTRYQVTAQAFLLSCPQPPPGLPPGQWFDPNELHQLALPRPGFLIRHALASSSADLPQPSLNATPSAANP